MNEPARQPDQLLPTVSIVEQTMRQARRAMAMALAGAAVMTVVLLAERLWSSRALERAADRHAVAAKLAGDVRLAGEQVALAAHMAMATGERHWIERYDKLAPELTQSIEHASLLAPPEAAEHYRAKTYEAGMSCPRCRRRLSRPWAPARRPPPDASSTVSATAAKTTCCAKRQKSSPLPPWPPPTTKCACCKAALTAWPGPCWC